MSNYVVILPTDVPEDRDEEYLHVWQEAADQMAAKPGFIRTSMYRTVRPDSTFRFVNVAEWEDAEQWAEAIQNCPMFSQTIGVVHFGGYEEVRAVVPAQTPATEHEGQVRAGGVADL